MNSEAPVIAVGAGNDLHIAWTNDFPGIHWEISYKKSTDGGNTWSALQRITWNSGSSYGPDIDINSSDVYNLVWYDSYPGRAEIFHKKSTDNGVSWGTTNRLTWSQNDSVGSRLVS